MTDATTTKQILLTRRSPVYWRVTFDHPPLNIFDPETIPQLNQIISALETDEQVKVIVFDSAVDGFFLTHYNFLAKLEDSTQLPPGPTGLQQFPDLLGRLSRAPVVSIAARRGRATGSDRCAVSVVGQGTWERSLCSVPLPRQRSGSGTNIKATKSFLKRFVSTPSSRSIPLLSPRFVRNLALSITACVLGLGLIALASHAQTKKSNTNQKEIKK